VIVREDDLALGPLRWNVFTRAGQLVAPRGYVIESETTRQRLAEAELVRIADPREDVDASRRVDVDAFDASEMRRLTDPLRELASPVESALLSVKLPGDAQPRKLPVEYAGKVGLSSLMFVAPQLPTGMTWRNYEGYEVSLRLMSGRDIYVFASSIMAFTDRPVGVLHVRYPAEAACKSVRESARINTLLPATLHVGGNDPMKGLIRDLSTSGAAVETAFVLTTGTEVGVEFELFVSGAARRIRVPTVIRNVGRGGRGRMRYGMRFGDIAPNDRERLELALKAYLYEQVIERKAALD